MIFGAALLGPECRHGLSGERSSWLLFVVGLELPVPTVSVLPVSSVPEVFDRWSAGERSELIGSEFLDVLASVPDPRDPRGRRYSLMALLAIAVLATAAGMRGYAGFATWAATASDDVLAQLGVRFRRPSEKTFRAVLSRLDPADLNARMGSYFTAHVASSDPSGLVPIALDGKMLRGALRAKATATHLVSVFAYRARLVLGQLAVAEKSNEIPCVRALLTLLPGSLRWLVTVDAMHTQVVTAKLICATLKSHYLMIVKSNQAKILARITALPWAEVPAAATDDSRGHGRVETRTLQIITAARGIGFPYAKQIIRITRERLITATDQRSVEWSMPSAACRSSTPPYAIMTWMRQHWGIDNSLHWIRDVTFDEDRQRAHTGNGAQVLATLRNTAINLHRLNGADNIAEACRITALTANRRLDLLNPQFPSSQAC
ncbi:transposase for IS2404 [Mycobacterium liflandii 128FXT]|uniref:Transposase for IS2404 n=1 Tax=Mycobacterium liflandii (strain 128FXT) TaxID=459424 RepID=L7VC11_MYCL1|nr:ISAs1 family transposase [Mycobacterium liflandii]AGC64085.1 transposase for IS2404 [Mycobacterium liflandii 128FXT]